MTTSNSSSSNTSFTRLRKSLQPFLIGGLCGCFATCCIQPVDMIKVRMQILGETASNITTSNTQTGGRNPINVVQQFIKNEGFLALYRGLDAALMRQALYTTFRVGTFRVVSDSMLSNMQKKCIDEGKSPSEIPKHLPLYKKFLAGLIAGAVGSFIGNPTDLVLTRLQADNTLPPAERRNYKGAMDALTRVVKGEGIFALWRGATPTILRAMALNTAQFATFDHTKELLTPSLGNGWANTLTSSCIAGFFTVTFSLPFDFLKTRIQKMKTDPITGKLPYSSTFDCAVKTFKNEGILRFYTGYPVYYLRVAPHAMIVLISIDGVNKLLKKYNL